VGIFIEMCDRSSLGTDLESSVHRGKIYILKSKGNRKFSVEQVTRLGMLQISHDGKPHFIHCTFAEFYVADCLVNSLDRGEQTFTASTEFYTEGYIS